MKPNFGCAILAGILALHNPAHCTGAQECDINDLQTPSWTVGGSVESGPLDVQIFFQDGTFPDPVSALIVFNKPPAENPCGFHPPGTGHRWARLNLPACYDQYEIRFEWELETWDHWSPSSPSSSDVFYLHLGSSPFNSSDLSNLSSVTCGDVGFSFTFPDPNDPTVRFWWGNDEVICPEISPSCVNAGAHYRKIPIPSNAGPEHIVQVGLNTGFLYFTHGWFIITVQPLQIEVLDPNPNTGGTNLIEAGSIVSDPAQWATGGTPRDGVAADGTTRVVLRRQTSGPGQVEFRIDHFNYNPDHHGTLSTLGGNEDSNSVWAEATQHDGKWYAFAVYKAPMDFVVDGLHHFSAERNVSLKATFHVWPVPKDGIPTEANLDLTIVRPPLVFLHGLWSSGGTWTFDLVDDPIFKVRHRHDYSGTNSFSFMVNKAVPRAAVQEAVSMMRLQGYASTKGDVIGHSMGGLLSRLYVTGFGGEQYKRNENFEEGDIHKLITICTPHKGSPVANFMLSDSTMANALSDGLILWDGSCTTCGAVADLRPDSQAYVNWLAQHSAEVPAHAIVTTGGSDILAAGNAALQNPRVRQFINPLGWFVPFPQLPAMGQHDGIVGRTSQEGNIAAHSSLFPYQNVSNSMVHIAVTGSSTIGTKVRELLNTHVTDSGTFASSIPARSPSGPGSNGGPAGDIDIVKGLIITHPKKGFTVTPGEPVEVTVDALPDFVSSDVLIVSNFDSFVVNELPATVELAVPAEAIGPMVIAAFALESSTGNLSIAEFADGAVTPDAELVSLSVSPDPVLLFDFKPSEVLVVSGLFDDGIIRDLTDPMFGTMYTSDDPAIAEVSEEGIVSSVNIGETFITVSNGAISTTADVEVLSTPVCLGDINGDGNVDISDLLILLAEWGPCADPNDCPADLDGNGTVDVSDLLIVLGNWGPCDEEIALPHSEEVSHCFERFELGTPELEECLERVAQSQ